MASSPSAAGGGFTSHEIDPLALLAWNCVIPCEVVVEDAGAERRANIVVPKQGYIFHSLREILPRLFTNELPPSDFLYFRFVDPRAKRRIGETGIDVPMQYPMCVVFDILTALVPDVDLLAKHALQLSLVKVDVPERGTALMMQAGEYEKQCDLEIGQRQKMACMIRFKTQKPRFDVGGAAVREMNEAIRTNDCRLFYKVFSAIVSEGSKHIDAEKERLCAPFIFHVREDDNQAGGHVVRPLMCRVPYLRLQTLGAVLREYFSCCYDLTDADCLSSEPAPANVATVLVMGAQPSLGTPTVFLMEHLCCVDMFVHVVLIPRQANTVRPRPLLQQTQADSMAGGAELMDFVDDAGEPGSPPAPPMSARLESSSPRFRPERSTNSFGSGSGSSALAVQEAARAVADGEPQPGNAAAPATGKDSAAGREGEKEKEKDELPDKSIPAEPVPVPAPAADTESTAEDVREAPATPVRGTKGDNKCDSPGAEASEGVTILSADI